MQRLGLLSFWHVHAADYAHEATDHPAADLVAVWDERPERGRLEAATRSVPFVAELDALLGDPAIDGVIVTTATSAHGAIIGRAAAAGKHVFVEKVIAPTLAESLAIVQATEAAGIVFAVALSRAVEPWTAKILELIAADAIGQPTSARVRVAHDGLLPTPDRPDGWLPPRFMEPAESGGGALIDLGAHPLYLNRLFLGMPERVSAAHGRITGHAADDNAAVLFHYANGAFGISETGFVSRGVSFQVEVNGTEGGILFTRGEHHLTLLHGRERNRINLPERAPTPLARWIAALEGGTSTAENVRLALELSALAEASTKSADTGCAVELASLEGWETLMRLA